MAGVKHPVEMRVDKAIHRLCALLCAACLLLCAACSRRPGEVLSDEQTASLLCDLHLAYAYGSLQGGGAALATEADDSTRKVLRQSVLARHGVSEAQFDTTLRWYGYNLDKYEEMYALVLQDLAAKKEMLASSTAGSGAGLWPYGARGRIAPAKGGAATLIPFEVPGSAVAKGGRLTWQAKAINLRAPLEVFIAAEYPDGSINFRHQTLSAAGKQEITLQTDSTRRVAGVWGYLRVEQPQTLILDSVSLTAAPLDPPRYYEYRLTKTSRL